MASREEGELLEALRSLDASGRDMLMEFARFLRSRRSAPAAPGQPLDIPRPDSETVVAAIRRLSQSYPMLDAEELLHDASELVSQHVMGARSAAEVIDELEGLFARRFQARRDDGGWGTGEEG